MSKLRAPAGSFLIPTLDLSVHPLSQLLDCATTARELRESLRLDPDESALAVFRVGRPGNEPVRSARIPTGVTG